MQVGADIDGMVAELVRLLNAKFGVRPAPLAKMIRRTGRRLPKRHRRAARALIAAQGKAAHPKLARQVDLRPLRRGYDDAVAFLNAIDPVERRKLFALRLAGALAFNVIAVAGAFILWLWWTGYV